MRKFEYKVVSFKLDDKVSSSQVTEFLDRQGKARWELVNIEKGFFIFKRELIEFKVEKS